MPNPVEQFGAKAMGAIKKGKAAIEGLNGVFRKLAQEHGEVSALLLRVKASSDPAVRAELYPKIRAELLSHEKGEITVVYPALREYPQTIEIANLHDREASQLKNMLQTLDATDYDSPDWDTQFGALVDIVQRHVAEEEQEFFPKGQEVLGDRVDSLQQRFEEVKEAALSELSAHA
jgi:hypothetical protein